MVTGLSSIVRFKTESSPSVGTREDSRGATQVESLILTKNPCCDATGKITSFTLFRYGLIKDLYPCSVTGASRLKLLNDLTTEPSNCFSLSQLGGPFDFCAFALLSKLLPGSLVIALKCTRPRQRFYVCYWAVFYDGGG